MSKLLLSLFVVLSFLITGCGISPITARQTVVETYPEADIINIPGQSYKFIVRDTNGSIWWVETMNSLNDKISNKTKLFSGKQ